MRGTVLDYVPRVGVSGITPACAGNSCAFPKPQRPSKDHPRVCGEQEEIKQYKLEYEGSPPRVRGTAGILSSVDGNFRITPACAGNRLEFGETDGVK